MRNYILATIATLMLFSTNASAIGIDTIGGFTANDIFEAQSNSGLTTTQLNGAVRVVTSADLTTLDPADGDLAFFQHDYTFTAITDTFRTVASTVENIQSGEIDNFIMGILAVGPGGILGTIAEAVLPASATTAEASINFLMLAGVTYIIRLQGDVVDPAPDYKLEVSSIPVPAAVWLFGTALLGLFGMRRKDKTLTAA